MARIFITGSADGLGLLAAKQLIDQGNQVVLHARNKDRGRQALTQASSAENVLIGDLSNIEETKKLANDVNELGKFDAVIHNAGVYQVSGQLIFYVNTLAPYILTSLIERPKRLIYLSSGMHKQGKWNLDDLITKVDRISYSDSKLHVLMLSKAVARKWPGVYSNSVDPGWVPTKMGGLGAPDDLQKGYETQAWLAVSNDVNALVTGHYFHHERSDHYNREADDVALQEKLLKACEDITGVQFPK
jgi:NAD(P)-dependent dehydrogenase (short-subunit alcohol dehydrogenase family)